MSEFLFFFGNVMKKITAKKKLTNKLLFNSTDSERDVQT